jgi:hypothetical protein
MSEREWQPIETAPKSIDGAGINRRYVLDRRDRGPRASRVARARSEGLGAYAV